MPSDAAKRKAAAKKERGSRSTKPVPKPASSSSEAPALPDDAVQPAANCQQHGLQCQFLFPACLSPKQRAILHELANSHGEPHASTEEGTNRRLSIGKPELPIKEVEPAIVSLSNAELAELLRQHLGWDCPELLVEDRHPPGGRQGDKAAAASNDAQGPPLSLEGFVAQMLPLIEMEKAAEVAQATQGPLWQCRPSQAWQRHSPTQQRRGAGSCQT